MENQNNGWKIWGIVAFVVIGFLLILLVGSYNAVMQLDEEITWAQNYYQDTFICADNEVAYCIEDDEIPITCPKGTKATCMWPEDYKEYYG